MDQSERKFELAFKRMCKYMQELIDHKEDDVLTWYAYDVGAIVNKLCPGDTINTIRSADPVKRKWIYDGSPVLGDIKSYVYGENKPIIFVQLAKELDASTDMYKTDTFSNALFFVELQKKSGDKYVHDGYRKPCGSFVDVMKYMHSKCGGHGDDIGITCDDKRMVVRRYHDETLCDSSY